MSLSLITVLAIESITTTPLPLPHNLSAVFNTPPVISSCNYFSDEMGLICSALSTSHTVTALDKCICNELKIVDGNFVNYECVAKNCSARLIAPIVSVYKRATGISSDTK